MIKTVGTVVAIDGDRALVEVEAQVCPRCAEGKGCGAGVFGATAGKRRIEARIPAGVGAEIDDMIELSLSPHRVLAAAGIVYGYPLAGAAVAALFAYVASLGDAVAAVCALFGLLTGAALVRSRLARDACLSRFVPTVERRAEAVENTGILRRFAGPADHEADP